MSFFHFHVPNNLLWPTLRYVLEYTHFQPNAQQSNNCTSIRKKICPAYASISTFPRIDDFVALQISDDVGETTGSSKHYKSKIPLDPAEKQTISEEVQPDGCQYSAEIINDLPKKRRKRKKKHGNKGRIPWNKGRKHTAETRALIKQRTIEALTNPQVRKKMSGHPRAHSEAIRAKISSSLRQLWGKRLKWKRLREIFFLSWTQRIARAAKEGGIDQQELDWDGYDKIKKEITLKQLQGAMEKAKGEEIAKRKVEREKKEKEEKMERVAQKRKEREEKAMEREETKRKAHRKSKEKTEESSVARKLTLKKRLTKIRKKKSTDDQMISQGASSPSLSRAWEKLNAEICKREKVPRETSLAEQIQAAKNKKTESNTRKALATPSFPLVC
ncbi:uncharacterized protein [Populus alba]|uniref:Calponin-likey domain-containing protein n=1 Tax=Populus alba TaxID=43335 RepID=A0A4U5NR36_POPAL|nr:histone-lysine N-methyltransferase, H3 lysine-79 specific-like isoform X2 [Populus alba]TKR86309.1 calponin-likey domain-containing protein [Populus alba]